MSSFANDKFVDNTETILSYLTNKDVENTPAETNIVREKINYPAHKAGFAKCCQQLIAE